MRITKITIVKEKETPKKNINDLLLVFGQALGLFSSRDKDKSCYRIFIVLVKALKANIELSSDDLAMQTGLTRGTIIHHLNRLMEAGIVTSHRSKYYINYDSLSDLVEDMRKNINSMIDDLKKTAEQIDMALDIQQKQR
jgi:predicted transcriptional regulator